MPICSYYFVGNFVSYGLVSCHPIKFSSGLLGGKFLCTSLFLQSILLSLATVLVSCPDFILVYSSDIIEF